MPQFLIPDELEGRVDFYAQSTECYKCPKWLILSHVQNGTSIPVNTTYGTEWSIMDDKGTICNPETSLYHFGQYGNYSVKVNVNVTQCGNCGNLLSCYFHKHFVKITFLKKKFLKS